MLASSHFLKWFQGKALGYLDEFLDSAGSHSYVLKDARGGPLDTIHAVCSKRPCLLSASLTGSWGHHPHRVVIAKELLPMVSNSPRAVGSLDHALSRAVDTDPRTYFESKQGQPLDWNRSELLLRDFRRTGWRFLHAGSNRPSWATDPRRKN